MTEPPRITGQNTWSIARSAADVHAPIATFTHVGMGARPNTAVSHPAAEKHRENRAIAEPTHCRDVGRTQKRLRLALRQQVPGANPSLHTADPLSQFRRSR